MTTKAYITERRNELTTLLRRFTKPSHQRVLKERLAKFEAWVAEQK